MKIYKKILNFGYGICCLLPILFLVFGYLYFMKTGENGTFDFNELSNFQKLGTNVEFFVKGELNTFICSVEWFKPFKDFNDWLANNLIGETNLLDCINEDEVFSLGFIVLYSEWVVLVSFFRLFGSVFGCMINFADRMLDKIGGSN